ncbi:hypothetical protein EVA_20182 [gut metagenome]|uniref:Uncharacterized protein n=1 Tax=gut metagenome TaxID=749906 RepID=J9BVX4_9ZZZZ
MAREVYTQRMTFSRYDDKRCLVYLAEEEIPQYVPKDAPEGTKPVKGYAYTGPEVDGGTLIDAADVSRDTLINGIIRSKYSQTEEDAIKTHQIELLKDKNLPKASEYEAEWLTFCGIREMAKTYVDRWLA